jgi:hypothetical protein
MVTGNRSVRVWIPAKSVSVLDAFAIVRASIRVGVS